MRISSSIVPMWLLVAGVCSAQPASLSGNWQLNVEKSRWGNVNKPVSVSLLVEHREPNLSYHGSVMYASEDHRDFSFSGAVDGKPYPMSRSFGEGVIKLTRVNPWTVESVFRTHDGNYVETARTTLSKDGSTLQRVLKLNSPEGNRKWTEIYEKR